MSTAMTKPEAKNEVRPANAFEMMRREFDEALANFWPEGEFALTKGGMPMMDVSETDNAIEVKLDLPGVKPEEIHVEVRGNTVHVTGERKEEKEEKDEQRRFHRVERRWGRFARTVTLPAEVVADHVEATTHDGVLLLKLPKAEPCRTKRVEVKPG